MDWKPAFKVTVDGEDITSILASRLVSLTLTDAPGVKSDSVEIALADHLPIARLKVPPPGAEITVALGYTFRTKDMGLFVADSVDCSGPPDVMRLRATASPNGASTSGQTPLTEQKTRSWEAGTTISVLVQTVAGEHGLRPGVSESLASIALPHIDQIDESDINLLTRIALDHDALAKVGGGVCVMAKRGESLTVAGEPMPVVRVTPKQVTTWRWGRSLRDPAGKVVASWRDQDAAEDREVEAGDGEPVRRLRRRYPDEASAQAAAESEYKRAARAGQKFSLTMPGDPDLVAEGRLVAAGFRSEIDGEWLVTHVTHTLDASGYRCSVSCEPPEPPAEAATG